MRRCFSSRLILVISLLVTISFFSFGQDTVHNNQGNQAGSRQFIDRQFTGRDFIDRDYIEREIYYRFGEYVDGVYIIDLQTKEYIDAHIQIDTRYDLNVSKILGNISIGIGAIIIAAIAIPAIVPALGPQIVVIVTQIVKTSIAGAAIDAALEGTITYIKTGGDTRATINHAIEGASEGFKWGAVIASGTEIASVAIKSAKALRIKTIRDDLLGTVYPGTDVPYVEKTIIKDGKFIKGVFPEFESKFNTYLPNNLLVAQDRRQFLACMEKLRQAIDSNPRLARQFTKIQLEQIYDGFSLYPDGFTWHHNEQTGLMQLVDSRLHDTARHTGGKSIWGGGAAYR
jgi:hypothetical protein